MRETAFKKVYKTAFLLVPFFLLSCSSTLASTKTERSGVENLSDTERDAFKNALAKEYPPYQTLSVKFTLKGKIGGEEIYYEGELSSHKDSLRILLKDAVFLSPLITLNIGKTQVIATDHARAKTEKIPREEYQWIQLFGRSYPLRFFEPMMRGYLPEEATLDTSTFTKTPAGETLVRADNPHFEAAMYFNDAHLKKIFYRDKIRGEILVFQLGTFFKNRNYPQTLRIEHTQQNDNLTLLFKGLRVIGEKTKTTK